MKTLSKISNVLMFILMILVIPMGYYVFQEVKIIGIVMLIFPIVYFSRIFLKILEVENRKAFLKEEDNRRILNMHYPVIKLPASKRKELQNELEELYLLKQNSSEQGFLKDDGYIAELNERITKIELQLDEDLLIDDLKNNI